MRCLPLVAFLALARLANSAMGQIGSAAPTAVIDATPRGGYFLGYRVAQALDKGLIVPALARWQGPELEAAVHAALVKMADVGESVPQ